MILDLSALSRNKSKITSQDPARWPDHEPGSSATAESTAMILDVSALSRNKPKITISARAIQPDGQKPL